MTKFLKIGLTGMLLLGLTACGAISSLVEQGSQFLSPKGNRLEWRSVTIVAADGTNLNSPVAIDIVLLSDDATLGIVAAMSAAKWFASRSDIEKTFPLGMSYRSVEVVPGQKLKIPVEMFGSERLMGVIVFADYLTPGEHRMRIEQLQGDIVVQLGERTFVVTAQSNK
jgi:type VI secretion system protein